MFVELSSLNCGPYAIHKLNGLSYILGVLQGRNANQGSYFSTTLTLRPLYRAGVYKQVHALLSLWCNCRPVLHQCEEYHKYTITYYYHKAVKLSDSYEIIYFERLGATHQAERHIINTPGTKQRCHEKQQLTCSWCVSEVVFGADVMFLVW